MKWMFKTGYSLISVLIFLSFGFVSLVLATPKTKPADKPTPSSFHYIPTIDFAQYALHQGDSRSSNLVEGFIPLFQSVPNKLSFADIRVYNPSGTPIEGNIDLGFRRLFHQKAQLLGLYIGYDRYRSDTKRYYNQANMGIECWYRKLFIGANGYLPFGTTTYDNNTLNSASLVTTNTSYRYNIIFEAGRERALSGVDAEVGYDITPNLTVYGGGYYFDHSDVSSIAGPKFRATYTFYPATHRVLKLFDRIRLEGLISHDSVRGTSWLAGLRFTFGFSNHSNPTMGLARHMTDPIRRDLNVISESFTNPSEFYRMNGHIAQADLVSNTSGRTIEDAVNGDADIIGVIGSQTAVSPLGVNNRDLTITGGRYDFTVDARPYGIPVVGNSGTLVATSGQRLFDLPDTTHSLAIEHITLQSPDNNAEILKNNGSFGVLSFKSVTVNGGEVFIIVDDNQSGTVDFEDNRFNLLNFDPTTSLAAVEFASTGGILNVTNFTNNRIAASTATTNSGFDGVRFVANGGGTLNISHALSGNHISLTVDGGNDASSHSFAALFMSAEKHSALHFVKGINNNVVIITLQNYTASALYNYGVRVLASDSIINLDGLYKNHITVTAQNNSVLSLLAGVSTDVFSAATLNFGDMTGSIIQINDVNSQGNTVYGFSNQVLQSSSTVTLNHFTGNNIDVGTTANGIGFIGDAGLSGGGTITVQSDFKNNTISSADYAISLINKGNSGEIHMEGAFQTNTLYSINQSSTISLDNTVGGSLRINGATDAINLGNLNNTTVNTSGAIDWRI